MACLAEKCKVNKTSHGGKNTEGTEAKGKTERNFRFYIGKFKGIKLYFSFFTHKNSDGSPSPAYHTLIGKDGTSTITINYRFLLLPKIFRLTILFHEYGHSMIKLSQNYFNEMADKNKIEAMAHFYACCECKLHFSLWREMADFRFDKLHFKFKKGSKNKERTDYYKNRFKDFAQYKLRKEEKDIDDYVYQFYKDTQSLIGMYNGLFRTRFGAKDMKELEKFYSIGLICEEEYLYYKNLLSPIGWETIKPFDWTAFLAENGWDNKNERLKYINL